MTNHHLKNTQSDPLGAPPRPSGRVELLAPENAELGTPAVVEVTLLDASTLPPPPPPSEAGSFTLSAITTIVTEGESVTLTIRRGVADAAASGSGPRDRAEPGATTPAASTSTSDPSSRPSTAASDGER